MTNEIDYNDGLSRIKINNSEERINSHEILLAMGHYIRAIETFQTMFIHAVEPSVEFKFEYVKAENASFGIVRKLITSVKKHVEKTSNDECLNLMDIELEASKTLVSMTSSDEGPIDGDELHDQCETLAEVLAEKYKLHEVPFIEPIQLFQIYKDLDSAHKYLSREESIAIIHNSDNVIPLNSKFRCGLSRRDIGHVKIQPFKGKDMLRVVAPINEGERKWIVKSVITQDEYIINSFVEDAATWKLEYTKGLHKGITCRDLMEVEVSYDKLLPSGKRPRVKDAIVSKITVRYDAGYEQKDMF